MVTHSSNMLTKRKFWWNHNSAKKITIFCWLLVFPFFALVMDLIKITKKLKSREAREKFMPPKNNYFPSLGTSASHFNYVCHSYDNFRFLTNFHCLKKKSCCAIFLGDQQNLQRMKIVWKHFAFQSHSKKYLKCAKYYGFSYIESQLSFRPRPAESWTK